MPEVIILGSPAKVNIGETIDELHVFCSHVDYSTNIKVIRNAVTYMHSVLMI